MLKTNPNNPERGKIGRAAAIIRRGGTVAFPTETVYGLGANALDAKAVKRVFVAKGRPFDDPLIVHISHMQELYGLVKNVDARAKILAEKFWPGPLTLVMNCSDIVPRITTGNLDSVAIRMPNNKIALALIEKAGLPIAAPSANLFGKPSPTSAHHVKEDLHGKIDAIIDGGKTRIGVESTVLDLTFKIPVILRPGEITRDKIEKAIGKIKVHSLVRKKGGARGKMIARAPGMKYKHYAPKAHLIVIKKSANFWAQVRKLSSNYAKNKVGVITSKNSRDRNGFIVKSLGRNAKQAAKNIFRIFREFDRSGVEIIISEGIPEKGLGMAVMNRMRKAADRVL